jgi:hypothetical protein
MTLPGLLRCASTIGMGYGHTRCDLLRFHPGRHVHREGTTTHSWSTDSTLRETYETDAPWVTWTWLSTDRETRFTGRMRMRLTCCVCGKREVIRPRIPRFGPVPEPPGGVHPERVAAKERHAHPDRGHPMSWALPLRNPLGQSGGLNLDLMAMRLEADLNQEGDDVR